MIPSCRLENIPDAGDVTLRPWHHWDSSGRKCDTCGYVAPPCDVCEGTGNGLVHGVSDVCGACDGTGRSEPYFPTEK